MSDPTAYHAITRAKSLERRMAEENRRPRSPITLAPVEFLKAERTGLPIYDLDPDRPDSTILLNDRIPF